MRTTTAHGTAEQEGPTDDKEVRILRARRQRNLLATLMLSQGVPMLLGGDEIGRTQHGNNNGYCQDNEISWYDWQNADPDLLQFTQAPDPPASPSSGFCQRRWFHGRPIRGEHVSDIGWFTPGGVEMSEQDWHNGFAKSLGVFLNGRAIPTPNERGEPVVDDSFYIMFNSHHEALAFTLPSREWAERWTEVLDTFLVDDEMSEERLGKELVAGGTLEVHPWSLLLLRRLP